MPANILRLAAISFLTVTFSTAVIAQEETVFRTEDEGDWYHPIEIEEWVEFGADEAVVEAILKNISSADGARHNSLQPDTLIKYGPGHWTYEWSMAGDAALIKARQAVDVSEIAKHAKAAVTYYHFASTPHLGQPEQIAAMQKATEAYLMLNKAQKDTIEKVDIEHDGKSFKAFYHVPKGTGPFPVVIASGGGDQSKEELLNYYLEYLSPNGIAFISLDVPGMNDSSNYDVSDGQSDKLHVAAVKWAKQQPDLDANNIFVQGDSFGGNAAARIFTKSQELDLAGVIFACGPIDSPLKAQPEAYAQLPAFTTDAVKVRLGLTPDANFEEMAERIRAMALSSDGLFEGEMISTPILAVTTNDDPVSPIEDLEKLLKRAINPTKIVSDEPGHCPEEAIMELMAPTWIHRSLR